MVCGISADLIVVYDRMSGNIVKIKRWSKGLGSRR